MVEHSKDLTRKLIDLMKESGYPLVQQEGQRKFGPPPGWTGPPPQKGCEVLVNKLPRLIFEDELVPVFGNCGKIYEMKLMMDFSGCNRGFAFVTYTKSSDAFRAVKELNGYEIIQGRKIRVVKLFDNCRLFVGNIPKTKNKEEVYEELSKWVSGIDYVILYKNCFDRRLNRGFAFVEFTSHRSAALAKRALVIPGCVKLWDQEVTASWAKPERDIDDSQMQEHQERKEYAYSLKEDGSAYGGSPYGPQTDIKMVYPQTSPNENYTLAPAKLDSLCKRYMLAPPGYEYQKRVDPRGTEVWFASVELPYVGLPLLSVPRCIGPLVTSACCSKQLAKVEAAENALKVIEMLQILIQHSSPTPIQPVYSTLVPPMTNCVGLPFDFMNFSFCQHCGELNFK